MCGCVVRGVRTIQLCVLFCVVATFFYMTLEMTCFEMFLNLNS
jgi:hypothetical protein